MSRQTNVHSRNYGCRLLEFIHAGYECIVLENEKLRVMVVAGKGADIYEFLYKPLDVDFMWRSPFGLRAQHAGTTPRLAGPHMDHYEGGWQELFPNCGAASVHQGAELGQHGEVLMLPWTYTVTRDTPDEIQVRFEVRTIRTPFHLARTMSLKRGESALWISEIVTNEGGQSVDFTWGHHPVLGAPFVQEGCRVHLGSCQIRTTAEYTPETSRLKPDQVSDWPFAEGRDGRKVDISAIAGPEALSHDMVFLEEAIDGWYAVTNPALNLGFGLSYPAELFKVLWYWQVYRGAYGYPWWGATYNVALEPCATMPVLARAAERGDAISLGPGESRHARLAAVAFEGADTAREVQCRYSG
ncbi:MAG TPA: aldose 1-epimerase [Blastocatellia bacterium]|nr:aldose 1-epimerase [Blastocatellia bacterium]